MKLKKSQAAGILFGIAMGILFSMMLGASGFVVMAPFMLLGSLMFKELDNDKPDNKK